MRFLAMLLPWLSWKRKIPDNIFFIAPTDTVEVSDEHALVTQTFKAAAPGLSARGGIRPGVNADLKNPTVEKAV